MSMNKFDSEFEWIPNCSDAQKADARAYLLAHAPDLLSVVFGEDES